MSLTWLLQYLSLALVLNTNRCGGAVPPCRANWFGSPCRYECHCVNNNCDKNGECTGMSSCERGWFGPSCQYVDLVTTNTAATTPAWVYDYPDILCNTGQETVTVSLDGTFYFTWLRLRVNAMVSPQDFTLQLMDANGSPAGCSNMYTSSVSDTLLDIHCQLGTFFQKLDITGTGVKWLCSVMVSGGRNVALGQNTTQTSVLDNSAVSSRAVDGDSNSHFQHWRCTHTELNDRRPTWILTFERSYHVNRYTIYNRDEYQERLQGFILEADQENSNVAFTYTDPTNTNHDIYRIPSDTPLIPVSSVNITATRQDIAGIFLTLCEVEMFGDTVCPAGYYGRECENTCNCIQEGDRCFVSTGGCPSGCAAGYQWEACQNPCNKTYFGVGCLQNCSNNCTDKLCQPTNGMCLSCITGKQGPLCDKDCKPTFWGDNCTKACGKDCKNQVCNAVTGTCISCVAGKSGENCDQACNSTYHGENCALPCNSNCTDQHCNATNGHCQSCLIGKSGSVCDEACPPTTFGKDCNETCSTNCSSQLCEAVNGKCASCVQGSTGDYCDEAQGSGPGTDESPPVAVIVGPVVAFVVLVTLIVIGVLIWRRRRHKKDEPEQINAHIYENYTEIDSVRTVGSSAMTTKPNNVVAEQAKPPLVIKRPNDSQDNTDQHYTSIDDCNVAPRFNETPICFTDQNSSVAESRNKYCHEQFNGVPTNIMSTKAHASSSEYQNSYGQPNINRDNPYETPVDSTTLTAPRLKSEDHMPYENDIMLNIYDSIVDNVPNAYENDM